MRVSDVRRERLARRREGYREAILHAAGRVILRKGYSALTMDDVAREAQLSKATVYKYVAGKGPLLFDILGHSFDDIRDRFAEIAAGPEPASDKLARLVETALKSAEESHQLNRVLFMDKALLKLLRVFASPPGKAGAAAPNDRKAMAALREKHHQVVDLGARVLAEGVASGEFRRMDTGQASAFIEAVLQGYAHMRLWDEEAPLAPGSPEPLVRFILEGIRNPETVRKEI
jgi:TetR/AcrR family transcriptional regulator, acrAB operon repressor